MFAAREYANRASLVLMDAGTTPASKPKRRGGGKRGSGGKKRVTAVLCPPHRLLCPWTFELDIWALLANVLWILSHMFVIAAQGHMEGLQRGGAR